MSLKTPISPSLDSSDKPLLLDLFGRPIQGSNSTLKGLALSDTTDKDRLKTSISSFTQIVDVLKVIDLDAIIDRHESDKWNKSFSTRDHLYTLMYAQLAGLSSLREIELGMEIFRGELNHLGMSDSPRRSTIAYNNEHREYDVFEDIFYSFLKVALPACQASNHGRPEKQLRLKGGVFAVDSTTIDLCLSLYDWALFRSTKGAVKLHLMLEHDVYLPVWAYVSEARSHDQKILETVDPVRGLVKGSYVVVDRAYNDFEMLSLWTKRGINFVCRVKDNMRYEVIEDLPVPNPVGRPSSKEKTEPTDEPKKSHVISDQIVQLARKEAKEDYPEKLRVVTFWVEENGSKGKGRQSREMRFFTNNFKLAASTIAELYRSRWEIESFFKFVKQNLKIKSFLGTSPNAVKSQLYVALLCVLILRYLQAINSINSSLSNMLVMLRLLMHMHRDYTAWLKRKSQGLARGRQGVDPTRVSPDG
jgi:hypothetical protein